MEYSRIAVVSYQDSDFEISLGQFLSGRFQITPVFLDTLNISFLEKKTINIFLVNSDALACQKEYATKFQAVVSDKGMKKDKSIIMLTRSLKASDFLRNMEFKAIDTIDIGLGMDALAVWLSTLLPEKQLKLFGDSEDKITA